jgi:hypothetical protein
MITNFYTAFKTSQCCDKIIEASLDGSTGALWLGDYTAALDLVPKA